MVRNLGDMLVKSFSVGKTHSVSQVTFLFWARLKGDVRHISHQPVIRANSLQTHTSTWRCSEAMQWRGASGCDTAIGVCESLGITIHGSLGTYESKETDLSGVSGAGAFCFASAP